MLLVALSLRPTVHILHGGECDAQSQHGNAASNQKACHHSPTINSCGHQDSNSRYTTGVKQRTGRRASAEVVAFPLQHSPTVVARLLRSVEALAMSTEVAQSTDGGEQRTKVAPVHAQTIRPEVSVDLSVSAASADGPLDLYLPRKWSWGPGKSSVGW